MPKWNPSTMKSVTLTIRTGNAAFADFPREEVARILRRTADLLIAGRELPINLWDTNGNHVGEVTTT